MTNDRTAAAIRRQFLTTADERPAEGHLEAILSQTSTLRQQPRWRIALRGLADHRAAPAPGAVLRYGLIASLLAVAVAGVAVLGGGSGGGTPFEGTWTSIDPADGSVQTLVVGPGSNPVVEFEDAFASACRAGGDPSTLFRAEGSGVAGSHRLTAHFAGGGCVTWRVPAFDATYDYDASTDTLLDHQHLTWRR